jgi:hypothetical protein
VAPASRASFFAACDVLDMILAIKQQHGGATGWQQLQDTTVRFYQLHKEAYGTELFKPKHHWQLDVPEQIGRDGLVLDAFVVERMHLVVKSVAIVRGTCIALAKGAEGMLLVTRSVGVSGIATFVIMMHCSGMAACRSRGGIAAFVIMMHCSGMAACRSRDTSASAMHTWGRPNT